MQVSWVRWQTSPSAGRSCNLRAFTPFFYLEVRTWKDWGSAYMQQKRYYIATKPQIIQLCVLVLFVQLLLRYHQYNFFSVNKGLTKFIAELCHVKIINDIRTGPVWVTPRILDILYLTWSSDFVRCSCALPSGKYINPINPIALESTVNTVHAVLCMLYTTLGTEATQHKCITEEETGNKTWQGNNMASARTRPMYFWTDE